MPLHNLRLPEGIASITVFEQTFGEPDGTVRGVEDHVAREIMAHDPRITEFAEGGPDDPGQMPASGSRGASFLARVATLDRTEIFAAGRAMKVSLPATSRTEVLREILIRHAMAMNPDDLPMVIGGTEPGGTTGMIMMPADVADDPNRGNDAHGKRQLEHHARAGGSTLSQETVVPGSSAANIAPAGLGPVLPLGSTQPPFNQIDPHTGKPSHDSGAAPLQDPRLSAIAGDPAFHAVADAHESRVADAIETAAAELDLNVAKVGLAKTGPTLDTMADRK